MTDAPKMAKYCKKHHRIYHPEEFCPYCKIDELEGIVHRVVVVRNDLATQTLNSHAVRLIDQAIQGDDTNGSSAA